mgnify:CR=1 FL=1
MNQGTVDREDVLRKLPDEIPAETRNALEFILVDRIDEALEKAIGGAVRNPSRP